MPTQNLKDHPNRYSRIAVLSAGPSLLKSYRPSDDYDCVIAINFAAFLFESDWFAFWDSFILNHRVTAPSVGKVVSYIKPRQGYITPREYEAGVEHLLMPTMSLPRSSYTLPNTLKVAQHLCELKGEIHLYGMDLDGTSDCLGVPQLHTRDEARWQKEREQLAIIFQDERILLPVLEKC